MFATERESIAILQRPWLGAGDCLPLAAQRSAERYPGRMSEYVPLGAEEEKKELQKLLPRCRHIYV